MTIAEPTMKKLFTLLTIACASLFLLPSCAKSLEQEAKQQLIKTLQERYGKQIELKKWKKYMRRTRYVGCMWSPREPTKTPLTAQTTDHGSAPRKA